MTRVPLKFIEPMKASSVAAPANNGEWIYEVKLDGFRVLAIKNGKEVELWSRNQKPLNHRFPGIVEAIANLSVKTCMLDGEVCVLDANGRSSFQLLQQQEETRSPVIYYVFDVLYENAEDLRALSLLKRKEHLHHILLKAIDPLRVSSFFDANPKKILQKMKSAGAEGVIAKLKSSSYDAGLRSRSWVKIKFHQGQEFVIVGYTLPKKSRKYFGALILAYYRNKRLTFAGRVGTGFNEKTLQDIRSKLEPLEVPRPQVEDIQKSSGQWRPHGWKAADSRWVKPQLVAQIQFTEWTEDGILRHASFLGLREDKNPLDVARENRLEVPMRISE